MSKHNHDDAIEWPNGLGYTPCTREYAETMDKQTAIRPHDENLDELSPTDYQEWCELQAKLDQMLMDGHLGKSVRY